MCVFCLFFAFFFWRDLFPRVIRRQRSARSLPGRGGGGEGRERGARGKEQPITPRFLVTRLNQKATTLTSPPPFWPPAACSRSRGTFRTRAARRRTPTACRALCAGTRSEGSESGRSGRGRRARRGRRAGPSVKGGGVGGRGEGGVSAMPPPFPRRRWRPAPSLPAFPPHLATPVCPCAHLGRHHGGGRVVGHIVRGDGARVSHDAGETLGRAGGSWLARQVRACEEQGGCAHTRSAGARTETGRRV